MNKISNNNFIYNNKLSFNGKSEEKTPMENSIQNGINKLALRAEREVPEYGDFAPVVEKITNYNKELKIGEPSIKIVYTNYNDNKTLRRVELDVPSVSGKSNANYAMKLTNKQGVLDFLSDENLAERIENNLKDAAKSFKDREFA